MLIRSTFFLILLLSFLLIQAQPSQVFTPEQLRADLSVLRENMEAIQPGLYTYYSKEQQDQEWHKVEAQLNEGMTAVEFYRLTTPMLKFIANGHNGFLPPKDYISFVSKDAPRFPFDLGWDGNQLFILRNLSQDSIIIDSTIIKTVNGQPVDELLAFMQNRMTRDGFNESLPLRSSTARFKTNYALLVGTPDIFDLTLEHEGVQTSVSVNAIPIKRISDYRKSRYPDLKPPWYLNNEKAYSFELHDDYAEMKLRTFSVDYIKQSKQKYKRFFKESFAQIQASGVEHLIIDLRGNGGGDTEPTLLLLSYLYDKPLQFYGAMNLKIKKVPNHKLYESKLGLINTFSWLLIRKKEDGYELRQIDRYHRKKKPAKAFDGQVYALIDAGSFSATGEMAGALKGYTNTLFIGEESGGNPVVNTSGEMLNLILPNTKVQATIPIVEFIMNVPFENDGRGMMPDFTPDVSIEDRIEGKDKTKELAIELVNYGRIN